MVTHGPGGTLRGAVADEFRMQIHRPAVWIVGGRPPERPWPPRGAQSNCSVSPKRWLSRLASNRLDARPAKLLTQSLANRSESLVQWQEHERRPSAHHSGRKRERRCLPLKRSG